MAKATTKTQKETAAVATKVAAVKNAVINEELCTGLQTEIIPSAQALADKTFGKGNVKVEGTNYPHFSNTNPGYGDITLLFSFSEAFETQLKDIFAAAAKTRGTALVKDPKRVGRATFEFASIVNGQPIVREQIAWDEWAGKAPAKDGDPDFSMLRKEWFGQSFIHDDGTGPYWFTIIGLSPTAKKPVQAVCSDRWVNDTSYVYSFEADLLSDIATRQPKRYEDIQDEMLRVRRPLDLKAIISGGVKRALPPASSAPKPAASGTAAKKAASKKSAA